MSLFFDISVQNIYFLHLHSNITSPAHEKLVWSLNFYTIEMTTKFLSDIDLLTDSVISANNILKRTNDLDLFYLILSVS